ncbi:MAG: UDP-glucose--hexose-1-phosphate uridylyltransferase [Bacillus sp. (in: firmicutes)]
MSININICKEINRLLQYAVNEQLITEWDIEVVRNKIIEVLNLDYFELEDQKEETEFHLTETLDRILDWAAENNVLTENTITYRDLLDAKIMGCFMPLPSEINRKFYQYYQENGPQKATSWFYHYSKYVDYIRKDRIAKNEKWLAPTEYGQLEITINLSKPEKDPTAILAAKKLAATNYPKCLLCKENAGYAGRVNHPARQNHRIIPVQLREEQWFLQFSPYVYYNEHAICFSSEHSPMQISKKTFKHLLAFVEKFPHYFMGSNVDLPIVGGSILSHEHFQGGFHDFPMAKMEIEKTFSLAGFPNIQAGIVKWPMSVIRLQGKQIADIVEAADFIFQKWMGYSDVKVDIFAFSDSTPHNTITPIARNKNGVFELDLVLRNNRTNKEHPFGIFHPHKEVHHIKKENIGLIEVMGLAVLPGRLKAELAILADCLISKDPQTKIQTNPVVCKHLDWALEIKDKYSDLSKANVQEILRKEVGIVFNRILHHAGVFKRSNTGKEAFGEFIARLNENSAPS